MKSTIVCMQVIEEIHMYVRCIHEIVKIASFYIEKLSPLHLNFKDSLKNEH